ncbi:hypothetical protein M91_05662 [Bos mutus]|uniref:Ras-GEF domain-containing protein n=1 Tax=Bos mutus TaxID=72004 RepID=L8I0U9_9CETA|nr:hypothetical protein M91_05662 [Bos mutus]
MLASCPCQDTDDPLISSVVPCIELLNRKDKTTFEKLDYLMSKEDNYKRTREYIRSLKMVPSIPYLDESPVQTAGQMPLMSDHVRPKDSHKLQALTCCPPS